MHAFHRFGDGSLLALVSVPDVVAVEFVGESTIAIKLRYGGFIELRTARPEDIETFVAALRTPPRQEP
jgi:hypothetical protein